MENNEDYEDFEGYDIFDSLHREMDRMAASQRNEIAKLKSDPCMDIPSVGDHVLVNATAVGRGRPEQPLEAEVLRIAGTSYEVKYLTYKAYRQEEPVVEWVNSYVVIAVIQKETSA